MAEETTDPQATQCVVNDEAFHEFPRGSATYMQVDVSATGVDVWRRDEGGVWTLAHHADADARQGNAIM